MMTQRIPKQTNDIDVESTTILAQRVDWLYKNLPAAVTGHLLGAIVTLGLLWRITPRFTLLTWFACCVATTIPGLEAYRRYRHSGTPVTDPRFWARAYVVTTCLAGIAWGAAGFLLLPSASLGYAALLSLILLGAAAGSVATDAVYFPAVRVFVIPCLAPLAIRLGLEGKEFYLWWSAGAVFIMLLLLATARSLEKLFVGALVAEHAAMKAQTLAERANQEKTRFLAAASHDLRQPLTSLAINTRLLGGQVRDGTGRALHKNVTAAVDDLKRVLNALLDISKLDAGTIEANIQPVAIAGLFASVRRGFEAEAQAKKLRLRIRSSKLSVRSDPVLLSRVVSNLVSNAIHHTLSGGVLVCCRKRGDVARIEIWDTGIGIPRDKWEEIFKEFSRLESPNKDPRRGLGLGLAIVRRISDLLGHPIEVHSVVGQGSRFIVSVPVASASSTILSARPPSQWAFDPLLGANIGVIEDEENVRRDLEALLKQWGCFVVSAESAIRLEEIVEENELRLDVIISDYQLKQGDGVEAIENLRAKFGNIPAVLITGTAKPHPMQSAMEKGIPILQKPFEIDMLRETLRELIATAHTDETDGS
jgi:two-component system, sensor histidine kinase